MRDPAFEDGVFVQSWILMDFPFGPKGETALDYFDAFLSGIDEAPKFQPFIDAARKSRLRMRLRSILRRRHRRRGAGRGWSNIRWPNVHFAKLGLFTMTTARASARRSLQGAH